MACQVKYHGNIQPTLSWSNNADGSLVIPSTSRIYDRSHGSILKSNLTVTAQSNMEWHKFICKANISKDMAFSIGWPNPKVLTLCTFTCVCMHSAVLLSSHAPIT